MRADADPLALDPLGPMGLDPTFRYGPAFDALTLAPLSPVEPRSSSPTSDEAPTGRKGTT
jgi:hypothetical protein